MTDDTDKGLLQFLIDSDGYIHNKMKPFMVLDANPARSERRCVMASKNRDFDH